MTANGLDALFEEGVLERVPPDRDEAGRELDAARIHLLGAEDAAKRDPTGGFTLAYDAARKAVTAHMRANGVRVRSRFGAHYQTGRYARAALADVVAGEDIKAFGDMREVRNDTEYGAEVVAAPDASEALAVATRIVAAVEAALA